MYGLTEYGEKQILMKMRNSGRSERGHRGIQFMQGWGQWASGIKFE